MAEEFEGKGPGRPAIGQGVKFNGRVPVDLKARVKRYADENFMTEAAALVEIVERGLNGTKN